MTSSNQETLAQSHSEFACLTDCLLSGHCGLWSLGNILKEE